MTRFWNAQPLLIIFNLYILSRISSSDGNDGDFVLSVRHEDHCHHLKIQVHVIFRRQRKIFQLIQIEIQ
jgi:hypothetical protein